MNRTIATWVLAVVLALAAPATAPAAAAQSTSAPVVTALAAQAESAPSATGEAQPLAPRNMRPYWHVFIAFGLAWTLLFGYAVSLGRRFGRLDEEVRRLAGRAD